MPPGLDDAGLAVEEPAHDVRKAYEALGAEDEIHRGRPAEDGLPFLLRHTSGNADQPRALTAPADELFHAGEDLLLRFLPDGTGVQNDDLRRSGLRRTAAERSEGGRHLLRIVDVHLATPGFDPKPEVGRRLGGRNRPPGGKPGRRRPIRSAERHSKTRRLRGKPRALAPGTVGARAGQQLGRVSAGAVGDFGTSEHSGDFLDPGAAFEGRNPNRIIGF